MTLQAHFHLTLRLKRARVDDGPADLRRVTARLDRFYVLATRSVTTLAVYPVGHFPGKDWISAAKSRAGGKLRIAVVAENAFVSDAAPKSFLVGAVIAGVHSPVAAFSGIPGQRKLDESAFDGLMQIGAGMISRPDYEIDFFLYSIGFRAVETDLITPLEVTAITLNHLIVTVGCLVIIGVIPGEIFNDVFRLEAIE